MNEAEQAQLFAIRNIVDALLLGAGALTPPPACAHPEREPDPESTWGNPLERCAICKARLD